ncbi:hypothetical protein ACVW00_003738 [Marmoricola sp. URHA0025 HA25]
MVYLRVRSRRRQLALVTMLVRGDIVWGAQVRQVVGRGWGASGTLVAKPDATLVFEPDAASVKRSAKARAWPLSETSPEVGPWRWDITGVRYRLVVVPSGFGEPELRFAAARIVGELPQRSQY